MSVVFTLITVIGISIRCIKGLIVPYSKRRDESVKFPADVPFDYRNACRSDDTCDVAYMRIFKSSPYIQHSTSVYVYGAVWFADFGIKQPVIPIRVFFQAKTTIFFLNFLMFVNANTSASGFICF